MSKYLLPFFATAGAAYMGYKLYKEYSNDQHAVLSTWKDKTALANFQVPHAIFPNYFKTTRGYILHTTRSLVPNPKGFAFFIHGFCEHTSRYTGFITELNKLGLSVCAIDLVGHGASQGDRNFVPSFFDYRDDVIEWINHEYELLEQQQGLYGIPAFGMTSPAQYPYPLILTHSMGGLIGSQVVIEHERQKHRFSPHIKQFRCFFSAPALALDPKITDYPLLLTISTLLSGMLPRVKVQDLPDENLSETPAVHEMTVRDPMFNDAVVVARFGEEFMNAIKYVHNNCCDFKVPLLIAHSTNDKIAAISGTYKFLEAVGSKGRVELLEVPGHHDILCDIGRDEILKKIDQFVATYCVVDPVAPVVEQQVEPEPIAQHAE